MVISIQAFNPGAKLTNIVRFCDKTRLQQQFGSSGSGLKWNRIKKRPSG